MKVRISVLAALFVFSAGNFVSAASFNNSMFADVATDHEYFDAIYFLHNTNVVEGYDVAGSQVKEYRADRDINRAEFLKLIMEGTGVADNASYNSCFPDVPAGEWFTTYVCQAKARGMVNGYDDGTFKPDQPINEIEAIKILGEVSGWQLRDPKDGDDWYAPYLEIAASAGIVPKNDIAITMNRGDIAEMIFRNTQVDYFDVPTFDETLVDDLFYSHNIPYGGAVGPGGLLGPGGPFGNAGAFGWDSAFSDTDAGIQFLGEDFYADKYCYYSDQGGHYERVEEILGPTDDDLSGFDSSGLGMMYCYSGVAATDLVLFTKEDRDSYAIACWNLPDEIAPTGGYEEIMCYVPPEQPDWVNLDTSYCVSESVDGALCTVCYESILSNSIISSECTSAEIKSCFFGDSGGGFYVDMNPALCAEQGGEVIDDDEVIDGDKVIDDADGSDASNANPVASIDLVAPDEGFVGDISGVHMEIFTYDDNGNPTASDDMDLRVTTGFDYSKTLTYLSDDDYGNYYSNFTTIVAGEYTITVEDKATGASDSAVVKILPGAFSEVQIMDVEYDFANGAPNKALINAVSVDRYGNSLPYSTVDNHLTASTNIGTVAVSHDESGHFLFTVETDDWGVAEVSIMNGSGVVVAPSVEVFFFPVMIDFPKGIEQDEGQIAAPMYVYFPGQYGDLGTYDFNLGMNADKLVFLDVEDPQPFDNFATPTVSVDVDGGIHVSGSINDAGVDVPEIIPVGTLLFNVASVGSGSIYVESAVLGNTDGEEVGYLDKFTEALGYAQDEVELVAGDLAERFWKWWYNIKPTKTVCIDAFIFEGSATTAANVNANVAQTNLIFAKLAQKCNCNFYLNVTYNIINLTAAAWKAIDANNDGALNSDGSPGDANLDEVDRMMDNHPAQNDGCIPVYYVPEIHTGYLGLSRHDGNSEGVIMDHGRDGDGRTLAHELAHQFSHNDVADQPDAAAHDQGADQPGNLMHYDDTGDNLTPAQCALIEARLP